jgi:hypothetical protein
MWDAPEVRKHHYNQAIKNGKMNNKQTWEKDTGMTSRSDYVTVQKRIFAQEHVVKHDRQFTSKVMMKDAKSLVVKKKLDEENNKLRDMAQEQRQKR